MNRPRSFLPFLVLAVSPVLPGQETQWFQGSYDAALAAAKDIKAGLLLFYCWRDDSDDCTSFYQGTVTDKAAVKVMADFVCMSAKKEDQTGGQLQEKLGVQNWPCVLFIDPSGAVVDVLTGSMPVTEYVAEIERVRSGKDTILALQKAVEAKPADLALHLRLANKLRAAGDREGAAKAVDAILAKDPKAQSEPAAEALLRRIAEATFRPEIAPQDVDLKELREFLVKQKNKRIVFLGWDLMMTAEWRREDLKAATQACIQAWKVIPADQVMEWGNRVVAQAYLARKDLDKTQQRLMLDIAKKSIAEAEKAARSRADGDAFLAERLYTFAAAQYVNNMRKETFATMERAIALDPKNENLEKALEAWRSGAK